MDLTIIFYSVGSILGNFYNVELTQRKAANRAHRNSERRTQFPI